VNKIIRVTFPLELKAPNSLSARSYLVGPGKNGKTNRDEAQIKATNQLYEDLKLRSAAYGDEEYGLMKYYKAAVITEENVL
jgi:hypothetical protein